MVIILDGTSSVKFEETFMYFVLVLNILVFKYLDTIIVDQYHLKCKLLYL